MCCNLPLDERMFILVFQSSFHCNKIKPNYSLLVENSTTS